MDVNTGKRLSENEVNTDSAADKVGKEEGDDTGKKKLDNEDMLKDADYLKYLTVNYQHSVYPENPDTELEVSVNGKADLNTMLNILKVGEQLIAKLEELLKGARDNLYIDVYVMSMLPNYYDYLQINAGKEAGDVSAAFQKEYEEYNASYASVEYIITGAGARKGQVFGNGVKVCRQCKILSGKFPFRMGWTVCPAGYDCAYGSVGGSGIRFGCAGTLGGRRGAKT